VPGGAHHPQLQRGDDGERGHAEQEHHQHGGRLAVQGRAHRDQRDRQGAECAEDRGHEPTVGQLSTEVVADKQSGAEQQQQRGDPHPVKPADLGQLRHDVDELVNTPP
jgi:hypothetical protein